MRSAMFIFLLAGAGALWLEPSLTTDNSAARGRVIVAQADTEAPVTDETGDSPTTAIEELTEEEIEAELKRAQELLEDPDAPTEFLQSKPLPADIAIDMPSDI